MARWEPCLGLDLPFPEDIRRAKELATPQEHCALYPTTYFRRFWRIGRLLFWLVAGFVLTLLLAPFARQETIAAVRSFWARQVVASAGGQLQVSGTPHHPALWVANHISWLDIVALLAVGPVVFVAKSEVARWPLIGWLARRHGTLFLERGSRGHATTVGKAIVAALAARQTVVLFPEGTTSDGTLLHPFHAALLQPAVVTATPIQPLALTYWIGSRRTTEVAFTGKMTLVMSLRRIVALPPFTIAITFGPLLLPYQTNRKALAERAHAWVRTQIEPSCTTTNPSAKGTGPIQAAGAQTLWP